MLSASANKLSRLKEQAEEYAALIMEELDPERLGYIEVGLVTSSIRVYFNVTVIFALPSFSYSHLGKATEILHYDAVNLTI